MYKTLYFLFIIANNTLYLSLTSAVLQLVFKTTENIEEPKAVIVLFVFLTITIEMYLITLK